LKLTVMVSVGVSNGTLKNISAFSGGGNRGTRGKSPTCHKSLTNFITYCLSSTPRNKWIRISESM